MENKGRQRPLRPARRRAGVLKQGCAGSEAELRDARARATAEKEAREKLWAEEQARAAQQRAAQEERQRQEAQQRAAREESNGRSPRGGGRVYRS
jgi:hypothetical protein